MASVSSLLASSAKTLSIPLVSKVAVVAVVTAASTAGVLTSSKVSSMKSLPLIFVAKEPPSVAPPAPAPTPTPTPTPTPVLAPASFNLGMNVAVPDYWSGERVFANLVAGSTWVDEGNGWQDVPAAQIDRQGYLLDPTGRQVNKILTPPALVLNGTGVTVRCTWTGTGQIGIQGYVTSAAYGDHSVEFFWTGGKPPADTRAYVTLRGSNAGDPVRNLDCREKSLDKTTVFAPEFIAEVRPFGGLRFMDWSGVNSNPTVTWDTRTLPDNISQVGGKGVAFEHMVALSNATGAEPWFNLPWNGDEDYLRRYAQYVHDNIPANRRVYVELSNEVWNWSFGVANQAATEGMAEGLSDNKYMANWLRYAEKTVWAMKIWTAVFADRPGQLVRVLASQHDNAWIGEQMLGFKDTANWVDAYATAPYFGYDTLNTGDGLTTTDTGALFTSLAQSQNLILGDKLDAAKALAKKYGKRFVAYEGGQHLIGPRTDMIAALNRSDKMGDLYRQYLSRWKSQVNDTVMLYSATGPINSYGAWGAQEYAGQPLSEAPKMRAILEYRTR